LALGKRILYEKKVNYVSKNKIKREAAEEIDLLDNMLSSLVDLLIEKGVITEEEYEKRIKQKIKIK
jgi:hypothetical protein